MLLCQPAAASPSYGYFLIQYYQFSPGCGGCHTNPAGGAGTVKQPFGLTMMSLGLTGTNDLELLVDTLNALGDSDSDGDGAIDAEEVLHGGDPNDPEVFPDGFVPPQVAPPEQQGETEPSSEAQQVPTPTTGQPSSPANAPTAPGATTEVDGTGSPLDAPPVGTPPSQHEPESGATSDGCTVAGALGTNFSASTWWLLAPGTLLGLWRWRVRPRSAS